MYLIFDTETTGLPQNYNAPHTDLENWPRLVQIAWQLHDSKGNLINAGNRIVKPDGFTIPFNSEKIHGISTDRALKEGHDLKDVLQEFAEDIEKAELIIGHNIEFDLNIMGAEFIRGEVESKMFDTKSFCTKLETTDFVAIPGGRGGKFKWPTLTELHNKLFGVGFDDAHDAAYDVDATSRCFFGLLTQKVVEPLGGVAPEEIEYEAPKLAEANFAKKEEATLDIDTDVKVDIDSPFVHLHVHTQFSVLQATSEIKELVNKAKELGMPAVAMTDHGNMFGAFQFVRAALAADIKPIVGCEFYVAEERKTLQFTKDNPDKRFNQVLIAKNKSGYDNLSKLSSLGYIEGLYGIYPRVDKELIKEYSKDVIALTGGLFGEVPSLILNVGEHQAEEAFQWWHQVFGDDFYVELTRHGLEEEQRVNEVLIGFAKKYGVKVIAANDVYYVDKKDAEAHDVLLCVKDGEVKSTPKGRGRGFRFGMANEEYYLKSQEEMKQLFADVPEAIENINEVLGKIETYKLEREVLLPKFDIPEEFVDPEDDKDGGKRGENAYLRHLTYEGAKARYSEITDEIRERLDFELATIENTGYPGYFLIVQDFTSKAREMGVSVGPGRGSAAGSAVAYCIGITNVDPIAYDLLFERFLNPDRISLPDIDIDFDDEGRGKVIEYVVNKYGFNQVAQIITYGTMAAKSSIRDCARVLELPLPEANALAKLVPERPGISLAKAFDEVKELEEIKKGQDLHAITLQQATVLEGSVRNTGTHACGVIISPDDLTKFIPVATSKDADLLITQFDNSVVEDAGMLKMDFLGLKTLSIINTARKIIKKRHNVDIDPDQIPLDDEKTYALYQRGETNGTFQFESPGMQKHLKALKPDRFEDLIAMNALYRPGPMEYIPNFIDRKHGREEIVYDIDAMEEYLKETYGITVYQEQVMLLSQSLAGFTKGEADMLRKGMGKKKKDIIDALKPKFLDGCEERGHDRKVAEKVWSDWEAFAAYAFNKSHSTCYSVVAYHTAYLKANYPAEYMAAVLTHNMNNIEKVTFFMEECRNLNITVLGPDVNESGTHFEVNDDGEIRFGLGAIKGSGEAAVEAIIEEREKNGPYPDVWEFGKRVNLKAVNKKTMECLAMSGAFDCFDQYHRKQYLYAPEGDQTLIEKVVKYANRLTAEEESSQASLFGGDSAVSVPVPNVPNQEPFTEIEKLNIERDVVGLYISGHPLDQFKLEIENFCTCTLDKVDTYRNQQISVAGIITKFLERTTKTGKPFGLFSIEDFSGGQDLAMFGEEYLKFRHLLTPGGFIYLKGKVEERYNQPGLWELRPNHIELLSEIRDKLCKGISLNVDLHSLNETVIQQLEELFNANQGDGTVKVKLYDSVENMQVETISRKIRLNPSNELFDELSAIDGVSFKVLSR